jgi:hypothetical protein
MEQIEHKAKCKISRYNQSPLVDIAETNDVKAMIIRLNMQKIAVKILPFFILIMKTTQRIAAKGMAAIIGQSTQKGFMRLPCTKYDPQKPTKTQILGSKSSQINLRLACSHFGKSHTIATKEAKVSKGYSKNTLNTCVIIPQNP